MGNSISGHSESNVFKKELSKLNYVVNEILDEKDIFKNKNYNFLSENVCKNYQVVLQDELNKHLRLEIKDLGTMLYVIPRETDDNKVFTKLKLTKKEVCDKISNHYIKVLYIICLIKYVYNLEKDGDLSIAGIIFRNIKIVDDMIQIHFCGLPHKDYSNDSKEYNIDFSKLEGLKFFTEYFLDPPESLHFLSILRSVLARASAKKIKKQVCSSSFSKALYESRLQCGGANLNLYVEKDNPIFLATYCAAPLRITSKLSTVQGKAIYAQYKKMKQNYENNIKGVYNIVEKLVYKSSGSYELKDISKPDLNKIINDVKTKVKTFYLQSILDFQDLLDIAKKSPNLHIT